VATPVEHESVDHGGASVLVAEQLLNGTHVAIRLQQMSGGGSTTSWVLRSLHLRQRILGSSLENLYEAVEGGLSAKSASALPLQRSYSGARG
jgi:hypothetical protein